MAHNGGKSVPLESVSVRVRNGSGERSLSLNASAGRERSSQDGDGAFEAGEWRLDWASPAGTEVTVLVVNA